MVGLRVEPQTRTCVPSVTEVLLYTTCGILEIIHIQLVKPSFGQRESEIMVVEKRVDLDSRLCGR